MVAWVADSHGKIPSNALPIGHDATGPLFAARASIPGGGVQIGKIGASFGAALIPYAGSEQSVSHYQVLVGSAEEVASGPAFPTAFAPFGAKGPAPAPQWAAIVPEVFPPDQHARNGFVPPVFGNIVHNTVGALEQYLAQAQGTPEQPVLEFSAIVCGQEQDGTPLFLALVEHEGGLHPGKVRLGLGGANIGWGGVEVAGISPYSVLCDATYGFLPSQSSGGTVPDTCLASGRDDDGSPLYFARFLSSEGVQVGKVGPNYNGRIGYAGVEQHVAQGTYQVMIGTTSGASLNVAIGANDGYVPDGAIVLGCEADGTPLFGAFAGDFRGGSGPWPGTAVQLGKVRPGLGGALIPYQGREVLTTDYLVLCAGGYQAQSFALVS